MVEILWNSDSPHSPVQDHEMVELRLMELGSAEAPSFLVREVHASWSAASQQIEWKSFEDEVCGTAQDAQRRFAERWKAAAGAGFSFRTVLS